MKTIIISIRSLWACKILNRDKQIEVRKGLALYNVLKRAEERGEEVEFLMYVTKGNPRLYGPDIYKCFHAVVGKGPISKELNGKVVAKFKAKAEAIKHCMGYYYTKPARADDRDMSMYQGDLLKASCLDYIQLANYLPSDCVAMVGTALRIKDLEIFDKPKTLADYGLKRVPQSWCYAEK